MPARPAAPEPTRALHEIPPTSALTDQRRSSPPAVYRPEPHILLFRRELGTDPNTGKVNMQLRQQAIDQYAKEFGIPK